MRPMAPSDLSPEQRQLEVAAVLARGILRRRVRSVAKTAADPLDSAAETRLSVVNGAESAPKKRAVAVQQSPRRLSPQPLFRRKGLSWLLLNLVATTSPSRQPIH